MGEKIDIPFARKILKDILSAADFNVTPEHIKKIVCNSINAKEDIENIITDIPIVLRAND